MLTLQQSSSSTTTTYGLSSLSVSLNFNYLTNSPKTLKTYKHLSFPRAKIRAVINTVQESESEVSESNKPSSVDFAFVSVSDDNLNLKMLIIL